MWGISDAAVFTCWQLTTTAQGPKLRAPLNVGSLLTGAPKVHYNAPVCVPWCITATPVETVAGMCTITMMYMYVWIYTSPSGDPHIKPLLHWGNRMREGEAARPRRGGERKVAIVSDGSLEMNVGHLFRNVCQCVGCSLRERSERERGANKGKQWIRWEMGGRSYWETAGKRREKYEEEKKWSRRTRLDETEKEKLMYLTADRWTWILRDHSV